MSAKQSLRVEAYGTVDEGNAALGEAKAGLEPGPWRDRIHEIQQRLFVLGAGLLTLREDKANWLVANGVAKPVTTEPPAPAKATPAA